MSGIEGAAIGPIWEAIKGGFCFCCARAEYFDDLEAHLNSFKNKIGQLKNRKVHLEGRVEQERKPHMQPIFEVTEWLKRVNDLLKGEKEIIDEAEEEIQKRAVRFFCPKHCCSFNKVGKRVNEKTNEVDGLINEAKDFNDVVERRVDVVDEMPVPETVGLEPMIRKTLKLIENSSVKIIGLHGMGGVGKTTLLKKIYNEICGNDYTMIWVENPQVEAAQEVISEKIAEQLQQQQKLFKKAIWNSLRNVKFVVMLDDLGEQWNHQRLEEVGVPLDGNNNGSKVIFTTRSEKVCDAMKATKIKLECLPKEDAVKLFKLHVGEAALDANWEISELAKDIAESCHGFPLLLTVIGRAMAGKTNVLVWKREREHLKNQPSKATNVKNLVFPVLKVSYDTLSNNTLKKCFLYFSLFSEGVNIERKEVIELWKAEGYLDELNGDTMLFNDTRANGESIIESLMLANLLYSGKSLYFVKVHDVIREMTLWLACEQGEAEDKFLVQKEALNFSKWTNAEKISLGSLGIQSLPQRPSCPFLTTLLLKATNLETLPSEFFQCMPALRVLSLSDNEYLVELPVGVGNLSNLHYLNLSGTSIHILPREVQKLKKLVALILDRARVQIVIPEGVISSLVSLQVFVFSMYNQVHSLHDQEVKLLGELECLEHINVIEILLSIASFVEQVLGSQKLQRCIKQVQLVQHRDVQKLSLARMEQLERLEVLKCPSLTEVEIEEKSNDISMYLLRRHECFPNLRFVKICDCPIKNVTCLGYVKNLQTLELIDCSEIVEVISEDYGQNIFNNLRHFSLNRLPKLKSIYGRTLEFHSLVQLVVYDCPELQSLPLDSYSAKNLKLIEGSRSWWDKLQWSRKSIGDAFSQKHKDPVHELVKAYQAYNPYMTTYYYGHAAEADPNSCIIQ